MEGNAFVRGIEQEQGAQEREGHGASYNVRSDVVAAQTELEFFQVRKTIFFHSLALWHGN